MTASVLLLAAVTSVAGCGDRPQVLRFGSDLAPGILVNRSPGARPFDPPDRARPSVVFVHGFNPAPRTVHFTMAQRLGEAIAQRGGRPVNVLSWDWNGATYLGLNVRENTENTIAHGQRLAAALRAHGLSPSQIHLIGHSSGGIVAASAARSILAGLGEPVAQLTLLEPAAFYHDVIFDRLLATPAASRIENYWAPGPSGFGREVSRPGVLNYRVDHPTPWLGAVHPLRSGHLYVVHWYLATVQDRSSRVGFNASVSDPMVAQTGVATGQPVVIRAARPSVAGRATAGKLSSQARYVSNR